MKEIDAQKKKWNDYKVELASSYEEGNKRCKQLEPLIKYIEEAMLDPDVTLDREVEWLSV